jgi:uncharacterized protein YbjT (DUF2867 family)
VCGMRIFLAGATGVIGIRLLPLLVADGHAVAGMTRSPGKRDQLAGLGAEPVVCDVFDADALAAAVTEFRPDLVMHQLTDLPDRVEEIADFAARNDRIRGEGTRNLIAAARAAAAPHLLAQSIAWTPPGRADVIAAHEQQVLDAGGVVVRYGQLYGPGTYYEDELPSHPRISVDDAARRTVPLLTAPSGVVVLESR